MARIKNFLYGEFDPGSGRTLAACLTHASRTGSEVRRQRSEVRMEEEIGESISTKVLTSGFRLLTSDTSGGRVSNAWVTCL